MLYKIFIIPLLGLVLYSCNNTDREALRKEKLEEEEFHSLLESSDVLDDDTLTRDKKEYSTLSKINFEDSVLSIYNNIELQELGLPFKVFRYGMIGFFSLKQEGRLQEKNLLSIIDFTQSSCNKRFYTIDLDNQEVIYHTYVSHGRNTGQDKATSFSNEPGSNKSSLGFYVTAETYSGSKGFSLRLEGMEKGFNENLRKRAVVMHGADYVSEDWIKSYGRLGRSQGCPALPQNMTSTVINTIKDRTAIFAFYDDSKYLTASDYVNLERLVERWANQDS